MIRNIQHNVLGTELEGCSIDPMTGYRRNGCCEFDSTDRGTHTLCALMTDEFLAFSQSRGNDLSTPHPEWNFPGLNAGDRWCLCVLRWVEAEQAGQAPPVVLEATHIHTLEYVSLETLERYRA